MARARLLGIEVLDVPLATVVERIIARPAALPFGYLVTPNADHFARLAANDDMLALCYASAEARVLDSRFLSHVGTIAGVAMPHVVTGSDLTEHLLGTLPVNEAITVVGTTPAAVDRLRATFGLGNVEHVCLPFGFDPDAAEVVDRVAAALRARPARVILFACGSPRQEILARRVAASDGITGFGLCIGSAVDQVGGHVRRAPKWLRVAGLEWTWRMLTEPRRLYRRYGKAMIVLSAVAARRFTGIPQRM